VVIDRAQGGIQDVSGPVRNTLLVTHMIDQRIRDRDDPVGAAAALVEQFIVRSGVGTGVLVDTTVLCILALWGTQS